MQEVTGAVEGSQARALDTRGAAEEVSRVTVQLREEMETYLVAMRAAQGDRHRFQRIPGQRAQAGLTTWDGRRCALVLRDLSVGGACLEGEASAAPGDEVQVTLPGAAKPLAARVARCGGGEISVAFLLNPANRALAEAAMDALAQAA